MPKAAGGWTDGHAAECSIAEFQDEQLVHLVRLRTKETLDARVDSAGKTYDSFGAHLRSRADKFYANGMPFSYTGAVNLNTTEHQLEFSGNFIYLGAKGE